MITILEKTINLIYPQVCSICGKLNTKSLCNRCKNKLEKEFEYKTDNYLEDYGYDNFINNSIINNLLNRNKKVFIWTINNYKEFNNIKNKIETYNKVYYITLCYCLSTRSIRSRHFL